MRRCTFLFLGNACLGSLLLIAGCSDEPLVPPEADTPGDPALSFEPYTGLNCEAPCLREDVTSGWTYTTNPPSGTYIVVTESSTPTAAGSSLSVAWCKYRISDDHLYGCLTPNGWWAGSYRSGKVLMLAQYNGFERVRFESTIPTPELEVVEFERPEPTSCSGSWCGGPFRLKVELLKSGWHHDDKISISVENAAGSRWPIEDSSPTASGDTYEWTWPYLFWPGAGSKLVVTYWPWNVLQDVKQEFVLPLADPSATLTLEASDSVVDPGTPVTFTAKSPTAAVLEVLSWDWQAEGTEPAVTVACARGTNPCTTAVHESGTMHVEARVDGQVRNASATVDVRPRLEVTCVPTAIIRAQEVACEVITKPTGAETGPVQWRFQGGGKTIEGPLGSTTWAGRIVVGGTVTVTADMQPGVQEATASFNVLARSWPSMAVHAIDAGHGGLNDPPGDYSDLGRAGRFYEPEFQVRRIDSGPNEGFFYVATLASAIAVDIWISRAFDFSHPWYQMQRAGIGPDGNPYCSQAEMPEFERMVRQHEGLLPAPSSVPSHMEALDDLLAQSAIQDLIEMQIEHEEDLSGQGTPAFEFGLRVRLELTAGLNELIEMIQHPSHGGTLPLPSFPCGLRF